MNNIITKDTTLSELVKNYPQTIELLNDLHFDYCCGGHDSIEKATNENEIDTKSFVELLNKKIEEVSTHSGDSINSIENFKNLSINEMIKDLEYTHHATERNLLEELDKLINKILIVHYEHHGEELLKVHSLFGSLKTELEAHFVKEEKLVFPLMVKNPNPTKEQLDYILELEGEHEAAGDIIKSLQLATNNYQVPEEACVTYERTYKKLNELVNDVFIHIFKENSILFTEYEELAA